MTINYYARPREGSFPRPPRDELGVGARSFADDTLRCHVGRTSRGRAPAAGPVALGSSRC